MISIWRKWWLIPTLMALIFVVHVIFLLRWFHLVPECFLGSALKIILRLIKIMQKYWLWYTMPAVFFLTEVQAPWACNFYSLRLQNRLHMNDDKLPCQLNTLLCPLEDGYGLWVPECLNLEKLSFVVIFIKVSSWLFSRHSLLNHLLIKLKYNYIFFLSITPPVCTPCFL